MTLHDPVMLAIPAFVVTLALEAWWLQRRGRAPQFKDSATSLGLGLGSLLAGALTAGLVYALGEWLHQYRLADVPIAWWSFLLRFAVGAFAYSLFHRHARR